MRIGRLDRVVHLDVIELGPPDHPFLLLGRQRVPRAHVVHIFLHVHIAAAGEVGILVADLRGRHRDRPVRVLCAVDEAHQVAVVEEFEAVHLVDDRQRAVHRLDDLGGQLEADVHRFGADVEQQIARCGRCVMAAARRSRGRGAAPQGAARRTSRSHASEPIETTTERRLVGSRKPIERTSPEMSGKRIVHGRLAVVVDRRHHEDRGRSQRRQNRLGRKCGHR